MLGVIGVLGNLPFVCSHGMVMTFSKLTRERKVRGAKHELIGQKPALEWVGEDLNTASLTIRLDSNLGMPPILGLKLLEKMQTSKAPHILLIGGEMLGRYVIDSIREERKFHSGAGVCMIAEVTLDLTEFSGQADDWASKVTGGRL
mgnify:CR=1 FL=1